MKVKYLLQLVLSTAEKGLWFDHDDRGYQPRGAGITLKMFSGTMLRPYTRPKYWFSKEAVPSKWNEFDPEYHGLLKLPVPLAPFVSIAVGRFGMYLGFKVFDLSEQKYTRMTPHGGIEGNQALTLSITTRRTRWK